MKIVIAFNAFKGSLTSIEAGRAAAKGINAALKIKANVFPLADGGDGTAEALCRRLKRVCVTGPDGFPVNARYGLLKDGAAVFEMASAAGLSLNRRGDALSASTVGVGELILAAYRKGVKNFLIGIGGSATTDCGTGMLSALGYRFFDQKGQPVTPCGGTLCDIAEIDDSAALHGCSFTVMCDVKNPLYGKNGAAYVYAQQKGASPSEVVFLDAGLKNFADAVQRKYGIDYSAHEGAGAAGGLGFAFLLLGGKLVSGAEAVMQQTGLINELIGTDLFVTGEGRMDSQSSFGKAPYAAALIAKSMGAKTMAFCGGVSSFDGAVFDEVYAIAPPNQALKKAMKKRIAVRNLKNKTKEVIKE